jgi:hypothetical protein
MDSRIPGAADDPVNGNIQLAFNTGQSTGIAALLGVDTTPEKRHNVSEKSDKAQHEKGADDEVQYVATDEETLEIAKGMTASQKVDKMEKIALYALHVEDDESLNPWTVCAPFHSL